MTDEEKKFLIENQDVFTLRRFARMLKMTPEQVYAEYDKMFRTGEYQKYYVPWKDFWCRDKNIQGCAKMFELYINGRLNGRFGTIEEIKTYILMNEIDTTEASVEIRRIGKYE